jgi:hypothetical protein
LLGCNEYRRKNALEEIELQVCFPKIKYDSQIFVSFLRFGACRYSST